MFRTLQILMTMTVFFLGSNSIAQQRAVQDRISAPPRETKGKFNRLTGEVEVTKGLPKGEFSNLATALDAFEEKGYAEEGLKRLESLLKNPYQGGEDLTNEKPGPLDAVVVIQEDRGKTKFTISSKDLSEFATFGQALPPSDIQALCHKVGPCKVCDGKVICFVRKLLKSRVSNANRP